jgi:hypothetical protein
MNAEWHTKHILPRGASLEERLSASFPVTYDDLFLYICFETLRSERIHLDLYVRLPGSADRTLVADLDTDVDVSRVVIRPVPMVSFAFERPGTYNFGLYVNEALIGSTRLRRKAKSLPVRFMRPTRNCSRRVRPALGSHRPSVMTDLRGARRGSEVVTPGIRRRSPRATDRNDQTKRTDRRSSLGEPRVRAR